MVNSNDITEYEANLKKARNRENLFFYKKHTSGLWNMFQFNNMEYVEDIYKNYETLEDYTLKTYKKRETQRQQAIKSLISKKCLDFPNLCLDYLDLSYCNLEFSEFQKSHLYRTSFYRANLSNANFFNSTIIQSYMGDCLNLEPEQVAQCKCFKEVIGLSTKFLKKVELINPKLMEWWNGKPLNYEFEKWCILTQSTNHLFLKYVNGKSAPVK